MKPRCQNPRCWDFLSPAAVVPLCASCRSAFVLGAGFALGVAACLVGAALVLDLLGR